MSFSTPFIDRPVATTLLTVGLTLAGALAFRELPVAPLPQVEIPTITVSASLPGASPETMAATVATPLERSLGRIAGITEMTSRSALGSTRITLQFDLDRDIDGAARDVQAALDATRSLLPADMVGRPSYRKVNPADAPVMILALTSDTLAQGAMYDVASTTIVQRLSQLKGVGQVQVGGSSLPAVRVELDPRALHRVGIGFDDVRAGIAAFNANRPKGAVEDGARHWQIESNDRVRSAAGFAPMVVAYHNQAPVRLRDVARVEDSVQDLRNAGSANGKPAVLVLVYRQSEANVIDAVDRVTAALPALRATIPAGIDLAVMMERTTTVRGSLRDAGHTLLLAVGLVILVAFVFLRNARAAIIPSVAVPVSLVGTFAAMHALGFSLNNFSLMALIIATGFVVDDAIVVLENVTRHVERGLPPAEAARVGARQVASTVVAMSLSLIAVFIPMLFMGGFVGRFFREFAMILAAAVLISLVVSLTTTPMMCARLLRRSDGAGAQGFDALRRAYGRTLAWSLDHHRLTLVALAATVGLTVALYAVVPKGFFPQQDTGQLTGRIQADQSISFQAMQGKLDAYVDIVRADPAVANVVGLTGSGQRNTGTLYIALKPLAERSATAAEVVARLRHEVARVPGSSLVLTPVQDIRVGGRQSRSFYEFTLQADDLDDLEVWEPRVRQAMAQLPQLADVSTDRQDKGLQTRLVIDRDAAARFGVTPRMVGELMGNAFAQRQVSTIYEPLNQYHVVMEVAPEFAQSPAALDRLHVKVPGRDHVPLAAFAHYVQEQAPLAVSHHGQFVASTVSFNLAPGFALSEATRAVDDALAGLGLPSTVRGSFQGSARAFREAVRDQPLLIATALLTVFIVLGILYESTVHPLTILSTLPSAGVGALLALMLVRADFGVIALVGVFMLIGIVMKNAIMMIDVAQELRRTNAMDAREAIHEAAVLRLRPILMTTLAALLAALPLAVGRGDGAELRQPLGIAVAGGLIASQLLTLYTTPSVYLALDRFTDRARAFGFRRRRGPSFVPRTVSR